MQMLGRGLQVGLVGGLGFDLCLAWFSDWQIGPGLLVGGLGAGLIFGLLLGCALLLFLLFLRLVDRLTGWSLAPRLQAAEPGVAGLIAGLLCTAPGLVLGGVGAGIGAWQAIQAGALGIPAGYGLYFALMIVPLSAFFGALGGALLGAVAGNGLVGGLRGLGVLRR